MPAYRSTLAVLMLVIVSASAITAVFSGNGSQPEISQAPTNSSGLSAALRWVASNQSSGGSFGSYNQHWAAAAAYALWLNNTHSSKAALSYSWLAGQLSDSSNWFWGGFGEADVPGMSLYSIAASGNLQLIHPHDIATNLLQFQQTNGGFFGYYSTVLRSSVTSSVDTSEALRGLIGARAINATSQQSAVNYLFTLQNNDGSFNLTKSKSDDNLYSQGPEPVSITALVVLALKDASYTSSDSHVSKALNFLDATISKGFSVQTNDTTPVYSASLSALAFDSYRRNADAAAAIAFILSHQNSDGGFRDSTRTSVGSNALDTGWAAIALQQVSPGGFFASFLRPVLVVGIVIGVLALAGIVGVVAYLVRRNRSKAMMPNL